MPGIRRDKKNFRPLKYESAMSIGDFQHKWTRDELRKRMDELGATVDDLAKGLDVPKQRIVAAIQEPKSEYLSNPHAESTRTLVGMFLVSMMWRRES